MFARVSEFKRGGKELRYVNERFEYFHHYWTLLFLTKTGKDSRLLLKPDYLFIEEERLESHSNIYYQFKESDIQSLGLDVKVGRITANLNCKQPSWKSWRSQ